MTFSSKSRRTSASLTFSTVPGVPPTRAALLITMWMPPSSRAAVSTNRLMASAFSVSQAIGTTVRPDSAARSAAACFSRCSVRAQMATSQPSSASWRAMARPMPRLAPVTMAFLPLSCRSTRSSLPAPSGMRPPGRGRHQLDLLGREQRTELRGKPFHEVLVGEHGSPVRATVRVVIELPDVDQLVDGARVGLEVADELLVLAALLERRVAELRVQLDRLAHLADMQRVGAHLIDRHAHPPGRRSSRRAR